MKIFTTAFIPFLLAGSFITLVNIKPGTLPGEQIDGPYVRYAGDRIYTQYIVLNEGNKYLQTDSVSHSEKESITLKVGTDKPGEYFSFPLQKKLQNQKSDYKKVSKQFVVSDIEGNFTAFRQLLQSNGVMDASYKWTFGDGHLVTIGDFFDRGDKVTEVLWLIYSLEEQANAAGGHVHFVLGNHEIMNLSDDLRYLNEKYKESAKLMNRPYMSLYDENTELGRWLRTKNVMERVGKMLYIHAGVSEQVNLMDITLNQVNQLTRPYYADTIYYYKDVRSDTLMGDLGPFWYRGYYSKSKPAPPEQVNSTLSKFGVKHIVTGHSLVADTVSLWYGGKVINTDTHHAKGHSEALLVDGDKFYRVNVMGEKFLLLEK